MTKHKNTEPDWKDGCAGNGIKPGEECRDCLAQREYHGYALANGQWATAA